MNKNTILWMMFKQWAKKKKLKGKKLAIAKQAYSLGRTNLSNYNYENKLGLIYYLDCVLNNTEELNLNNYNEDQIIALNEALIDIQGYVDDFKKNEWNK